MKTRVQRDGDTTIIRVEGQLSFEDQIPFKEQIDHLFDHTLPSKVIFNMEDLDFVGSSGISSFFQTLSELQEREAVQLKYCNVKSEFQKIMKALSESEIFDCYESLDRAKSSFDN